MPVIGQDYAGALFEPTSGKQVGFGAKGEWLAGKLLASVAAFRIEKDNISVTDPDHAGFNIQTGQITSDGLEFDVSGSPLPGLNLIGNLALTDARVTRDTRATVLGKRPANTPSKGGGLWASYELQDAQWRGVGVGLGVHHVGRRQGDSTGTFFLPAYSRWDASLSYRAAAWRVALKMENLFDKTYYVSAHDTLGTYPGAPRGVMLSSSYQF